MSRYEARGERYSLAYGVDRATGVFVQVWDHSKHEMPDPDNVVFERDRIGHKGCPNHNIILEAAKLYEIPLEAHMVIGNLLGDLADVCDDICEQLGWKGMVN